MDSGVVAQCLPVMQEVRVQCTVCITNSWCDMFAVNPCDNNQCQNGAACLTSSDFLTYTCSCATGYTGTFVKQGVSCIYCQIND